MPAISAPNKSAAAAIIKEAVGERLAQIFSSKNRYQPHKTKQHKMPSVDVDTMMQAEKTMARRTLPRFSMRKSNGRM